MWWALYSLLLCLRVEADRELNFINQNGQIFFIKQEDISIAASSWVLHFEVDLNGYVEHAEELLDSIQEFIQHTEEIDMPNATHSTYRLSDQVPERDHYYILTEEQQNIKRIGQDIQLLIWDLRNMSSFSRNNWEMKYRRKRSLLGPLGSVFKYVFGLRTEEDGEKVRQRLAELNKGEENIKHYVNDQMTIVKTSRSEIIANRLAIRNVTESINDYIRSMKNIIWHYVIPNQQVIYRSIDLIHAKEAFIYEYNKLTREIDLLHRGLESALAGFLTPSLLTPELLRQAIVGIRNQLPKGLNLIKNPREIPVQELYQALETHLEPSHQGVAIAVYIPLQDESQYYSIYRIRDTGSRSPSVNNYDFGLVAHYELRAKYLAISQDQRKAIFLDQNSMNVCKISHLKYCLNDHPVFQISHLMETDCILGLFYHKAHIQKSCPTKLKRISPQQIDLEYLTVNTYAITVGKPVTFTIVCQNGTSTQNIHPPIDILRLNLGCTATSPTVYLANQLPLHSTVTVPVPELNLQDFHGIWTPINRLLKPYENKMDQIQVPELLKAIPEAKSIYQLENTIKPFIKTPEHMILSFTSIIGVSLAILLIFLCWMKPRIQRCCLQQVRLCAARLITPAHKPEDTEIPLSTPSLSANMMAHKEPETTILEENLKLPEDQKNTKESQTDT